MCCRIRHNRRRGRWNGRKGNFKEGNSKPSFIGGPPSHPPGNKGLWSGGNKNLYLSFGPSINKSFTFSPTLVSVHKNSYLSFGLSINKSLTLSPTLLVSTHSRSWLRIAYSCPPKWNGLKGDQGIQGFVLRNSYRPCRKTLRTRLTDQTPTDSIYILPWC